MDTVLCVVRNLGRTRELADVTLVSGDGEQVEAHGVIRSAGSPLLRGVSPAPPQNLVLHVWCVALWLRTWTHVLEPYTV